MASDWPALAKAARQMLAQREASAYANVEKGRLTREQAADRIRVARALSRLWDTIAAGQPPYDFETAWIDSAGREGTYPHELRADLDAAAGRARILADRKGRMRAPKASPKRWPRWHGTPARAITSATSPMSPKSTRRCGLDVRHEVGHEARAGTGGFRPRPCARIGCA
ncbi:hypothetical protein [Sphingomonas hankookensis]|uniref:hypothetical protein n=1 Tax=Sphingomonas hankookensis TaxID=563996 RepID=UPI003D30288E